MTKFETAINAFDGIVAPAGFTATASGTFVPAVGRDDWFAPATAVGALAGAGADWGFTPAPAYNDVAEMSAAVDEAEEEDRVRERSVLWSTVADVEADYRSLKIDGREG